VTDRIELEEKKHSDLGMKKQCVLLGVARSSVDYQPVAESPEDLRIKRLIDEIHLIDPCLGTRRLKTVLAREHGLQVNRKKRQRLRREMGIEAIYCKPRTSIPDVASILTSYKTSLWSARIKFGAPISPMCPCRAGTLTCVP
jgi:hypothetical protein